ncbi:MAG: dodecin family protein [Anaerolineales bacterium]|jgi:flavin-binding protein dodecin
MTVVKVIEVVGTSKEGWEDAVKTALKGAKETLHGISGIELVKQTATVEDGEIKEYRATVKIAFKVD